MIFNASVAGGGSSEGGSGLLVTIQSYDNGRRKVLDKTAQEIADVIMAGGSVVVMPNETSYLCTALTFAQIGTSSYTFTISGQNYYAFSPTDYPTYSTSGGGAG